jgi:CubicO group peptidase (beta-lactamase class C family)
MRSNHPHPFFTLTLLGLLLSGSAAAAEPRLDPAALDAIVNDALKAWHAPGMAVAVVRGDEVVYLKGFGVRERGGTEPVTPDTVFGIGSCTKAFTATAIGLLVEEGKMAWDDPVRKHVPTFRLADPLADRDVTLRDLLCHRTGLAAHDHLWLRAPWPLEESVRRMAYLEPASSFRSKYEYNNLCYLVAGFAISSAAKQPWNEFVQQRLLDPLGMGGAVFTKGAALKAPDHATPHRHNGNFEPEVMPWYDDDRQIRASGSIKAGVRDLSKWLRLQLNGGVFDGKRVVAASTLAETHRPQMVVPLDPDAAKTADTTQMSYGLGWAIADYRGHHLLSHGGAVDGFRAHLMLFPKDRLGIMLLTNVEEKLVVSATGNALADQLLGLDKKDWNAHYLDQRARQQAGRKALLDKLAASRQPGTKPSRPPAAYAGRYEDPAYGVARVEADGDRLVLHWSSYNTKLRHFHYDTFTVEEERFAADPVSFSLGADGEVQTLRFLGRTFKRVKTEGRGEVSGDRRGS